MGLTGRYNFTGIQKAIGVAINTLALTTSWGAWLMASPFKIVIVQLENLAINWLTNRGLIILNIGAIMVDGSIDQSRLDTALNDALTKLQNGRDKISPADGAAIDKEVSDAFDQDADLGAADAGANVVSNLPGPPI